jgi:hypothetical protein
VIIGGPARLIFGPRVSVARHGLLLRVTLTTQRLDTKKRIHRFQHCGSVGLLVRRQQPAADERFDFALAQFKGVAPKSLATAAPARPHPFGCAGASYIALCCHLVISSLSHPARCDRKCRILLAFAKPRGIV